MDGEPQAEELPTGSGYWYFRAATDGELSFPDGTKFVIHAGTVFLAPMPQGKQTAGAPVLTTWPKS